MSGLQGSAVLVSALTDLLRAIDGRPVDRAAELASTFLIGFPVDSPALQPDHERALDELVAMVLDQPGSAVVAVVGRASQTGPEANNQALAFDRAETVRAYLLGAGLAPSRVGPTVANGSGRPVIDVPGREAEVNRSVELVIDWRLTIEQPPQPPAPPADASSEWELDLSVTFGADIIVGGQVQIGRLRNVRAGTSKLVTAFLFGVDVGKSVGITVAADVTLPTGTEGSFTMPTPPGPVGYEWFDGRYIRLTASGFSAILGGRESTTIQFENPGGKWPAAETVDYPIGLTLGIGVLAMDGFLNVDL